MASLMENLLRGAAAGVGFVIGASATLATARQIRPIARGAVKSYIIASDRAREATAGLAESVEDLYAEAKAQREAELRAVQEPTPAGAGQNLG